MDSAYPFNPLDWNTIIPLYTALRDAPIPPGGFLDWLGEWNQLDIAIWDAYTALKRPTYSDTRDQAAAQAYSRYVQALYSTYLGLTNQLITRALTVQPEAPSPVYEQLWRRWRNQQALFHPANLPIQAEISGLEIHYRAIMNSVTPDDPAGYWLDRRVELNDLMLRLIRLRRSLAQNSGLPHFLAYRWRELNRLDYTIADCQAFHQAIERIVVPVLARQHAAGLDRHARPEVHDLGVLKAGVERMLQQIDPEFGAVFRMMGDEWLDFGDRPGKAQTIEEWFFPGVGLPYLHVASTNVASVLHESGHGMHDYLSFRAHGSMWHLNGPEEFQEFAATSMELLGSAYYEQAHGGFFSADESAQARRYGLQLNFDWLAECALQDAFEHWVYGAAPANVTARDLDTKWLELKARFHPWDGDAASSEAAQTEWQRDKWSLFRMPLYMITYPMAFVGACQFAQQAESDRAGAIRRYKMALTHGNTRTLPALFRTVGLDFPFPEAAVAAMVQFVTTQL
jgi:oligoendopeptidase F